MMGPSELIMEMFNARTAAHVSHLMTRSYAAHKALNEFYDGVVDIADRFAEACMGRMGDLKFGPSTFKLETDPIKMLQSLRECMEHCRSQIEFSELHAILDDGMELIDSTIYKLSRLK